MSDVGGFELGDIEWEFGDTDDHIVPHPGVKTSGSVVESDSFKRLRTKLTCAGSNSEGGHSAGNVIGWKEEGSVRDLKEGKETMLEKNPQSRASNGSLSASLDDLNRNGSRTTSEELSTSKQCLYSSNLNSVSDLCTDDPILVDETVQNRPNKDRHTGNDLTFLGDSLEDKGDHDLLFYGWPDLENFEDVDSMFGGCDSTLGLELDDHDDMSWFTSSPTFGGSDDALKSSFEFSGLEPCGPNTEAKLQELSNNGLRATESIKKLTPVSSKTHNQNSICSFPSSVMNSYSNGPTQSKMKLHVRPSKHQKFSDEKGRDWPLEDDTSYIQFDTGGSHILDPRHNFVLDNGQGGEVSHHLQMPTSVIPCISHSSNFVKPSLATVTKSGSDGLSSVTLKGSSHVSNLQSVESFQEVSIQNPTFLRNKKKGRHRQRRARCNEKPNFEMQRAAYALKNSNNTIFNSENEAEDRSEVDGNDVGLPGELNPCTRQESSCMNSVLDELPVDECSLQQLQHAMEQLDMRTKLCIKDSLYRLAKSAEQRHHCFTQTGARIDDKNANGGLLLSDGTNKCGGFIDMETDTNPIDRSIAHLLFHRPSDPSAATTSDAVAIKSHTKIPGN